MANPSKLQATVTQILTHGPDVYELHFKPLGRVPRFKAGQFLHLTLDEFDPSLGYWPQSRVFSIASSFGADELCIVYSVKGTYTARMAQELAVGKTVWLKLPYGDFSIDERAAEGDSILIAGGTGISPYIPVLENYDAGLAVHEILLYYGVRNFESICFLDLLKKNSLALPVTIASEQDLNNIHNDWQNISLLRGRLDPLQIVEESKKLNSPNFFLSGPPLMIENFKKYFLSQGIEEQKIHIDDWE